MSLSSSSKEIPIFQLKGSTLSVTVLELTDYHLDALAAQLKKHVEQAPSLFAEAPLILSLDNLPESIDTISLIDLRNILDEAGFQLIGIQTTKPRFIKLAKAGKIALLNLQGFNKKHSEQLNPSLSSTEASTSLAQETLASSVPEQQSSSATVDSTSNQATQRSTLLITSPIRSGQQVYAENCDLIVTAAVSAGAELLSDGHIHVYGALRGRALAGVKGDTQARIFCQNMSPELVSIAGNYKVAEDLRKDPLWGEATSITLSDSDNVLNICPL